MFDRFGRARLSVASYSAATQAASVAVAVKTATNSNQARIAASPPSVAVMARVVAVAMVVYALSALGGFMRSGEAAAIPSTSLKLPEASTPATIVLSGHLFTHGCGPVQAQFNGRPIRVDGEGNFGLQLKIPSRTLPAKLEFSAPGCSNAVAELDISPGLTRYTVSASILPEVALAPRGQYRDAGRAINKVRRMLPNEVRELASLIEQYCAETGLDPALVYAIVHTESHFDRHARSRSNAVGLMQLVPTSGAAEALTYLKADERVITVRQLRDPETNIRLGTAYMQMLMDRYFENVKDPQVRLGLALAAYNWGPTNVQLAIKREGRTPRTMAELNKMLSRRAPRETRRYVKHVTERMAWYAQVV